MAQNAGCRGGGGGCTLTNAKLEIYTVKVDVNK